MPEITWTHPFLDVFLNYVPLDVNSVLDVGCGRGIVGALLKIYRDAEKIVGVDNFFPYLEFCRKLGTYDKLMKHDLNITPLPFNRNEFDLSVALEVIEHVPKRQGLSLLDELERVSRRVIISTPDRFFLQSPYDGNIHQQHFSKWSRKDFTNRGYSVRRLGDLVIFGKKIKYLSYILGKVLSSPQLSSTILATYQKS